jgi:hypothetical protein
MVRTVFFYVPRLRHHEEFSVRRHEEPSVPRHEEFFARCYEESSVLRHDAFSAHRREEFPVLRHEEFSARRHEESSVPRHDAFSVRHREELRFCCHSKPPGGLRDVRISAKSPVGPNYYQVQRVLQGVKDPLRHDAGSLRNPDL